MYVSVPCARTHRAPPGVCLEGDLPLPRWLSQLGHAQGDIALGETRGGGPNRTRSITVTRTVTQAVTVTAL